MWSIIRSNVVLRRSAALAALALALVGLERPSLAGSFAVQFGGGGAPAVNVPFADRAAGEMTFTISGKIPANIEIYPQGGDAEETKVLRATRKCVLKVQDAKAVMSAGSTNCSMIMKTRDALGPYNISPEGGDEAVKLTFEAPATAGAPAIAATTPRRFPAGTAPAACYVNVDGWQAYQCTKPGTLELPDDLAALVDSKEDALHLVAYLTGANGKAWYKVPIAKESAPAARDLEDACRQQLRLDRGSIDGGPYYALCVDVTDATSPRSILMYRADTRSGFQKSEAPSQVLVRTPMVVYVWHEARRCPDITHKGDEGLDTREYVSSSIKKEAGKPAVPCADPAVPRRYNIGPQKGDLSIDVKVKLADAQELTYSRKFTIEKQYWTAVRLGLGVTWSPWARDVELRTAASGTKYVAITRGDGAVPGLFNSELVISYSYFFRPLSDLKPRWSGGLNAGLGFIALNNKGADAFTSIRVGFELNYGLDFSIGLSGGFHRHDVPKDGFQPGAALPSGTNDLSKGFGVTPGFGLILNMTPSIFKTAGIAAGG